MSDKKDKPLNSEELSKVADIVTESSVGKSKEDDSVVSTEKALNEEALPSEEESKGSALFSIFRGLWRVSRIVILIGIVIGSLLTAAYVLRQDDLVRTQFEGKRWALPARVFARPLELYEGQSLSFESLQQELQLLGYRYVTNLVGTGQFTKGKNSFSIQTRGFKFAEDQEISRRIRIEIKKNKIIKLSNTESNEPLTLMRLEPVLIGNFYPTHNEDRVLVKLDDVTPLLAQGLVAVEDKKFLYALWGES